VIAVGVAIAMAICASPLTTTTGGDLGVTTLEKATGGKAKAKGKTTTNRSAGAHLRIATRRGPIHVFRPAGYDRRTAGMVVYVHGLYTHVDQAWRDHQLREQFAASRRNALFIAPEAPATVGARPSWASLRRLITTTLERAHLKEPPGPVVVVGHSGAYRTIVPWLDDGRLQHLILLDALYGNEAEFGAWLEGAPTHQMTLVVRGTAKRADPFVHAFPDAVTLPEIPASLDDLSPDERDAKLLCLRSQYGHFEIVTEGKVLPVLLGRAALPALRRPPARQGGRTPPP
jgi:hypothetical protein